MTQKYVELLDEIVKEVTLRYSPPCQVSTREIAESVDKIWHEKGYKRIDISCDKVGRAMARLGFWPYRNRTSQERGWLVD